MENFEKEIRYQLNSLPQLFFDKKNSSDLIEITVTVGKGVYEEISVSDNEVNLDCTMGWSEGSFAFKIPVNEMYEMLTKEPFHKLTSILLMEYDWELIETSNGDLTYNKVNDIEIEREDEIINSLKGTLYEIDEDEIEDDNKYDLITDQMYTLYNRGDIDDSEYNFNTLFSLEFSDPNFGKYFINWDYHEEILSIANTSLTEKKHQEYLDLIFKYLQFEYNIHESEDFSSYFETLELSEKLSNIIINISKSFEILERYDQALIYIDYYTKINPNIDFGYEKKAVYLEKLGRKNEAVKNLKVAIELNPNKVSTIISCSDLLKEIGEESESIELLKYGINKNPKHYLLYSVLAHIYYKNKDWIKSKEYYEKSLEINNDSAVTNAQLGFVYFNLKNYELAATKLKHSQLLDNDYKNTHHYYFIGESLKNINNFQEAIDQYHNCINLEVDHVHVYAHGSMGYCYLELGDFQNCIKYSSKGLKESFNFFNVGKAYFGIKDYSKAIEYFDMTTEIQSNYKWAYHWKGDTLFEMKRYPEALECYNKLLTLDPNYTNYVGCIHIADRITFINNLS